MPSHLPYFSMPPTDGLHSKSAAFRFVPAKGTLAAGASLTVRVELRSEKPGAVRETVQVCAAVQNQQKREKETRDGIRREKCDGWERRRKNICLETHGFRSTLF